jgi:3,4-dihydroxy 2-butanone 4-phosphate synthase/GTP cyclohydrolase II
MTVSSRIERVQKAIAEIRAGKMVILVDDEDRENEGDLVMAAELVTPEAINFMARYGRGLICMPLTEERIARLGLPMMVEQNRAPMGTAFTVSVEARRGVSTGISAADRAATIRCAVSADARAEDLVSPGHVFPLRARKGGVLVRTGQTEGSVDLARLAGLEPASVICEIMRDDGEMARMPDLERFGLEHGLMVLTIADLIEYRLQYERLVVRVAQAPLAPAMFDGAVTFTAHLYEAQVGDSDRAEYLALTLGDVSGAAARGEPILTRVQAASVPGDLFAQHPANTAVHVKAALSAIVREGLGVFLYVQKSQAGSLRQAFEQHVLGRAPLAPHAPGPLRDFGLGAQVLADLGLKKIRLLSNNAKRIAGLGGYSIEVTEQVSYSVDKDSASPGGKIVPLGTGNKKG